MNASTWEQFLSAVKLSIAGFVIVSGIATMFQPILIADGALGWIYGHRIGLILAGLVITAAGSTLMAGKIRRRRNLTGLGLMMVYLVFVFSATINWLAFGFVTLAVVPNVILSLVVAALWLRWRFKTFYLNPDHFIDDVDGLRPDGPPSRRY